MNSRLKRLEQKILASKGPEMPTVKLILKDGSTVDGMLPDALRLMDEVDRVEMGNDADLFNLCNELLPDGQKRPSQPV